MIVAIPASFSVTSPDGTSIAVWQQGAGPPLLMVHGAVSDHTNDAAFAQRLEQRFNVFAMDRRGRGESGDATAYSIDREFEDVATVVDEVAARMGTTVHVWGHSFGADCAIGGALLTSSIDSMVLYEPGLGIPVQIDALTAVESAIDSGQFEQAAVTLFSQIIGLTDIELEFVKSLPTWPDRVQLVPTVPREVRAEGSWTYHAGKFAALNTNVMILAGAESFTDQQNATVAAKEAIPGAQVYVLEGHAHIAHRSDPDLVAGIVEEFLLS